MVKILKEIIFTGLLRGWPGGKCPVCSVKPGRDHKNYYSIGHYDGGIWA